MLTISYDKLFAYLYKNSISKSELAKKSGISRNTIDKMTKNELVHMSVIVSICNTYDLKLEDVVELYEQDEIQK